MSVVLKTTRLVELEEMDCCECDIIFALPTKLVIERRQDGGSFYCPRGHSMAFTKSENSRLRAEVERLKASLVHERDQRSATLAELEKADAEIARQRKRAAAGVCPCCHRTFANVARHMGTRHPDYSAGTAS